MFIKFFLSKKFQDKKIIKKKNKKIIEIFKEVLGGKSHIIKSLSNNYSYSYKIKQLKKYKSFYNYRVIGMGGSILGRLKQELEELQTEYDEIKPTTPTGTTDWYVKWISMLLAVAGIFLISASYTLYGQMAYVVSCIGWIYVGMQWGDRASIYFCLASSNFFSIAEMSP